MASLPSRKFVKGGAVAGTFNGVAAASGVSGEILAAQTVQIDSLSAVWVLLADTSTITLTCSWQGSDDRTTWIDIAHAPNNAAGVVFATGTAGADTAVTKCIPCPQAAQGFRYLRPRATVGVVTGAAVGAGAAV